MDLQLVTALSSIQMQLRVTQENISFLVLGQLQNTLESVLVVAIFEVLNL